MKVAWPDNEAVRLEALRQYQILDTEPELAFDELTQLAARICNAPIALISLIDRDRQWFKSKVGFALSQTSREISFCDQAIEDSEPLIVPDTLKDARFANNPLVVGEPYIRFYAGAPLSTSEGLRLGTLCVIDYVPRDLAPHQLEALQMLSHQVMAQLDLRRQTHQSMQITLQLTESQTTAQRTSEQIAAEITSKFGFLPPFFGPAQVNAQVFEHLWQQTWLSYASNPWPAVFKEKLSAYLSRYCAIPYCMICHSCSLRPLGVKATDILGLLSASPPTELEVDQHLQVLAEQRELLYTLPYEVPDALEASLLNCAIFIFLSPERAEYCRRELRRLLSPEAYQHLVAFIAYVKTCHFWMEAHPEVAYTADRRFQEHFTHLIQEEPGLVDFLENYQEQVRQEYHQWTTQQAAIAERKRHEQAIQAAAIENLRLARAINAVADGVIISDPNQPDNPIIYSNPAFSRITGYEAEEVIGCNCRFLQGSGTDLAVVAQIREAIAEQREVQVTLLNYRKDGQPFWNELKISPIFSDTGELLYFVGVQTDVSQRKQSEEERLRLLGLEQLARQEAETAHNRLTRMLESMTEAFYALNQQWCFTYVNSQAERLLQKTQDQLMGKSIWEQFPEAVGSIFYKEYRRALSEGVSVEFQAFYPPLNRWFEVHAYPSQEGLSVYFQDITGRRQVAYKLREQATLLDVATDAIWVQGLDSEIFVWNKGAENLYGWTAIQAIGQQADQLLTPDVSPQLALAWQMVLEKGKWQGELHQITYTGQEVVVASRWTLVRDEQNRPKSILVVNTDITEKKQLEAQFLRAQRMESIGTLAGGIAHDLNNVLAPILMSTQLLARKVQDEHSLRLLSTVEVNAKRGADLVKQVLSFARGVEGERTLMQVRHLILETAKIAKETFPKSIEVYTDIPQSLWTIAGDATQLHQVLMNLCVNARDAMPSGGTLSLVAENLLIDENYARMHLDAQAGPYIVITVTDTGMGMPAVLLDRIFEPFFTTKALDKGTGLGLSTVMAIVKSHRGFLTVSSQVNKGTEFKVYLPATEASMVQVPEEDQELPNGHGELILVVDDEAAIREITKTSLEAFAYNVITAHDGIDAIALYAQQPNAFSAVIVDMMMPVMDGPTTIRTLRRINAQVKVIAMSGLMGSDQLATATNNVDTFLTKPFTAKQLLQSLHQLLQE